MTRKFTYKLSLIDYNYYIRHYLMTHHAINVYPYCGFSEPILGHIFLQLCDFLITLLMNIIRAILKVENPEIHTRNDMCNTEH